MANFRVGQRVVCIKKDQWFSPELGFFAEGPKFREECIVTGLGPGSDDRPRINVEGYDYNYLASRFRPLITLEDDVELFKRISEDSFGRLEVLEQSLNESY